MISYVHKQNIYAIDCASINHLVADNTPRIAPHVLAYQKQKKISTMSFNNSNNNLNGSRLSMVLDGRKASTLSYRVTCSVNTNLVIFLSLQSKPLLEHKRISEASTLPEESNVCHATISESNIAL